MTTTMPDTNAECLRCGRRRETCDDCAPEALGGYAAALRSVRRERDGCMAEAAANAKVINDLRTAMRAIGDTYHVVELAAERARLAGCDGYADKLEHVYGRLYFMDNALGTLQERVAGHKAITKQWACGNCGHSDHEDADGICLRLDCFCNEYRKSETGLPATRRIPGQSPGQPENPGEVKA